jgi:photosystem II stability/assembly factor-like uncharacterized protein
MRSLILLSVLVLLTLSATFVRPAWAGFYWANPQPTGSPLEGVDFDSPTSGYAVGAMGTTLRTTDGGVTWQVTSDAGALGPQLEDVVVLASGVLLAAGETPGLHRSTDGGATWTPIANPANGNLRNLFKLDASTIFVVGDNGRALRSTDGGTTFASLTTLTGELDDQYWRDVQHGFVIGQQRIRRTTDGGQTWLTIPGVPEGGFLFGGDVSFLDANNGWIVTDFEAYRTTDGGANWIDLNHPIGQSPIYQDECLPLDVQTRIVASNGEGAEIWKTTNGGANWTRVFEHDGTTGVSDMELLPDGSIVAISTAADLIRSTDAGNTWTNFTTIAGPQERATLYTIDMLPSGFGFAGGLSACWISTTDGGRSWFDPPATPGLGQASVIAMRDSQFILAGGIGTHGQSDVRRTTDGGTTWTTHSLSPTYAGYPQGLVALSDGTCFCATAGGQGINYVFRSTDSGATWHLRNTGLPTNRRWFDIQFLDSQNGFVCGGESQGVALYRTTNGGANWTPVGISGLPMTMIQDMHWHDAQNAVVVGDFQISRTTNGGTSWTTPASGGWAGLDFRDPSYGVATELDGAVRITTDGGATWTRQVLPTDSFLADVVATPDGFLIVGDTSEILGWSDGVASVESPSAGNDEHMGSPLRHPGGPSDARGCIFWPNPCTATAAREISFRAEGTGAAIHDAAFFDPTGRRLGHGLVTLDRAAGTTGFAQGRISLEGVRLPSGSVRVEMRDSQGNRYAGTILIIR